MEDLFTNVPVLETINIIINNIYRHPTPPLLKINSNILCKILYSALLRYHFTIPMEIYTSKRMELRWGQFWGPFSATFTYQTLKKKLFNTINNPNIYLRYADDILLLLTNCTDEINITQETFQNNSILNFTQEININNKIPFLGVLIDTSNIDRFITSTYKKKLPTLNPAPSISIVNAPFVIKEQS